MGGRCISYWTIVLFQGTNSFLFQGVFHFFVDPHLGTKSRALSKSQRCFAAFAAYHQYHSHCCEHAPEAPWLVFLLFLLNHPLTHFCWGQKSFWRSVFGICLLLVWGDTPSHMLHGTGIFTNKFTINFMPCMSRWAHLGFIFGLHVRGKRVGPKNEHPDPPNDTDSQEVNNTLQEINISPW